MQYIEPREVSVRTSNFEMQGTISGTLDAFKFESSNSHFNFWFKEGEIDSLKINRKSLKPEQIEIIVALEDKVKELLS